jgi:hypothetical protein
MFVVAPLFPLPFLSLPPLPLGGAPGKIQIGLDKKKETTIKESLEELRDPSSLM